MNDAIAWITLYLLVGLLSASVGARRFPNLTFDSQSRVAVIPLWWLFWIAVFVETRATTGDALLRPIDALIRWSSSPRSGARNG